MHKIKLKSNPKSGQLGPSTRSSSFAEFGMYLRGARNPIRCLRYLCAQFRSGIVWHSIWCGSYVVAIFFEVRQLNRAAGEALLNAETETESRSDCRTSDRWGRAFVMMYAAQKECCGSFDCEYFTNLILLRLFFQSDMSPNPLGLKILCCSVSYHRFLSV